MLDKASIYLPHKEPMMLLDTLIECQDKSIIVDTVIDDKYALFGVSTGKVPAWLSIEIMAQTVGVWAGYHAKKREGSDPKIGFLLGGRQCYQYIEYFSKGDKLRVEAQIIMQDQQMANFAAKILDDAENVVAEGRLTTYQPNDVELTELKKIMQPI